MALPDPRMFFIEIATLADSSDFTNWLDGQKLMFNDSMDFQKWAMAYTAFPLKFYLDGVIYEFKDRDTLSMFQIGFEAAMNLRISTGELA